MNSSSAEFSWGGGGGGKGSFVDTDEETLE